jgi:ribosomal protein S11
MVKFIAKKKNFFFGKKKNLKYAIIVFKRTHSNIFITLLDLNNKVIICKSSGISKVGDSKKKKIAPQAIENIVKDLSSYFILYKISFVNIFLKVRITVHILNLVRELERYGIKISSFVDIKRLPHNGLRGKNLRRV